MTYSEFNENAFGYYSRKAFLPYCTLAVDDAAFREICGGSDPLKFDCLKTSWVDLLQSTAEPRYFGLIAIQCYAALLMDNDDEGTTNAYKVRLKNLLGLNSNKELENLFEEEIEGETVQELIWQQSAKFIADHWQQQLLLPPTRKNVANRYVQFPKSQALLNREDLRNLGQIFQEHFPNTTSLDFDYFKNKLYKCFGAITSSRVRNILTDSLKSEQAYRQAYNCYFLMISRSFEHLESNCDDKSILQFILTIEKDIPRFFLLHNLEEVESDSVVGYPKYKSYHVEVKIFNKREFADDEYEDTPSIVADQECFMLLRNYQPLALYRYLVNNHLQKFILKGNHTLFKIRPSDIEVNTIFKNYCSRDSIIRMKGGLRLNSRRVYLAGLGPTIEAGPEHRVFLNGKLVDYKIHNCQPGIYHVQNEGWTSAVFSVVQMEPISEIIQPRNFGWRLNKLQIEQEPDMEGTIFSIKEIHQEQVLNTWLKLNLSPGRSSKQGEHKNILLKALENQNE